MEKYNPKQPTNSLVIYALRIRDRTQGFLHTGDFLGPDVETREARRARRMEK